MYISRRCTTALTETCEYGALQDEIVRDPLVMYRWCCMLSSKDCMQLDSKLTLEKRNSSYIASEKEAVMGATPWATCQLSKGGKANLIVLDDISGGRPQPGKASLRKPCKDPRMDPKQPQEGSNISVKLQTCKRCEKNCPAKAILGERNKVQVSSLLWSCRPDWHAHGVENIFQIGFCSKGYTSISEQAFQLFQGAVRLRAPSRILYLALLKMPEASRTISSNCNDQKQSVRTIYVISGLKTSLKYTWTSCNLMASICSQINDTSKESGGFFQRLSLIYCMGLGSLW